MDYPCKTKNKQRRKPLLLRGARQVGKTWLIEKLANDEFDNLLKIDFEETPELSTMFDADLNPQRICTELELRTGVDIIVGKTLLFIDGIQACPKAIMSLRYFYEKMPDLHVVAAGSLLEFALGKISFPVGRIQSLEVHPMTFSEFLRAIENEKAAELCTRQVCEVSEAIHKYLMEQLRIYWLVGGMPECVREYVETKSIKQATEVQQEICETYQMDFGKYKPSIDTSCLASVFTGVAAGVGQQIKYTGLAKDYTIPTIKKAYSGLELARISRRVKSVSSLGLPMAAHASDKKFKALFLDIGLMNHTMGIDYNEALNHENLLSIYRGQLAEQYVGQTLAATTNKQLYYWSRDAKSSNAEIDYLIQQGNDFIPIEVKDGSSGKLRSLHMYRETYKPKLSIVFHSGMKNELKDEGILFLPLYFVESLINSGC
ncbi:MAG: ATP-binding protein [Bacteroidales bacterium]